MIGALLLGLAAGVIARAIVPNRLLEHKHEPTSWLASILLGLLGSFWGWLLFTACLGIGDTATFDWGGTLSALIGVLTVLIIAGLEVIRASGEHHQHRHSRATESRSRRWRSEPMWIVRV